MLNQLQNNQLKNRLQRLSSCLFLLLALWCGAANAYDPTESESKDNSIPPELQNVGITEQLGTDLSKLDLQFTNEEGKVVPLKSLLTQGRPVVLSLVYYNCASLCNLHLNGVFDVLKQLTLVPGKDFDFLAVSFDAKETSDLAAAKKVTYQDQYSLPNGGKGIHFLTGDENSVKTLADAVGFKYKWMDKTKEWAHASAAILITPDGVVSRYLHGVYFEPKTFRFSIVEASQGKVGNVVDSVMLFCFRYDPQGKKLALYSYNVMRAACALVVILVLIWLVPFWLRQSRKTTD